MRAREYIDRVTAYIGDPAKAIEVQKELGQHLAEASAEVEAQGIDRETAELVAVARMGDPQRVAMGLAEAHHKHLPWRHYLAVLPALALLATMGLPDRPGIVAWRLLWLLGLVASLVPRWAVTVRLGRMLLLDLHMKYHWLERQPLKECMVPGMATGGTLAFFLLTANRMENPLFLVLTLVAAAGTAMAWWRYREGHLVLTGVFAAIGFPPVLLATFRLFGPYGFPLQAGLMVSAFFALLFLAAGYLGSRRQRQAQLKRI